MKTIFDIKRKSMIPESLQPFTDRIGIAMTGIATYLNVKLGFLGGHFSGFLFSPGFNSMLTIVISLLSILWIAMKIYDQYLVTKVRKQEMTDQVKKPKRLARIFKSRMQ